MFRRLKNLWELSRFEITKFDHELVITEKEGKLMFAHAEEALKGILDLRPKMAEIIKRKIDPIEEIINHE